MKILMINPNWKAYSEVWLHRMISYLGDMVVGIACFSPLDSHWENIPSFDLYGKKRTRLQQRLNRYNIIKSSFSQSFEKDFIGFVKKTDPDIILINFIGPALYLKKSLDQINLPVFIHVHGPDIFWTAMNGNNSENIHDSGYINDVLNLANNKKVHFIVNSKYSRNQLLNIGIAETKISLKYFGVSATNLKRVFNKNKDLSILFLGRFVDFKGPDIVVNAFIKACSLGLNGTLTMVGDGPLKLTCELIAKRSVYVDRIIFKTPVGTEEAAKLMLKSDIYTMHNCWGILSNMAEAFGVTIIEAMSNGTPVITGRYGGPKEIIIDNFNGILVEPGNIDAHANAFIYLQNNPERLEELSNNGLETIRTKFSLEQEKDKLLQILASGNLQ